jgi:hypothetical protein
MAEASESKALITQADARATRAFPSVPHICLQIARCITHVTGLCHAFEQLFVDYLHDPLQSYTFYERRPAYFEPSYRQLRIGMYNGDPSHAQLRISVYNGACGGGTGCVSHVKIYVDGLLSGVLIPTRAEWHRYACAVKRLKNQLAGSYEPRSNDVRLMIEDARLGDVNLKLRVRSSDDGSGRHLTIAFTRWLLDVGNDIDIEADVSESDYRAITKALKEICAPILKRNSKITYEDSDSGESELGEELYHKSRST